MIQQSQQIQPKRSPPTEEDEDAELDLQAKLIYHAYRKRFCRPKPESKGSSETGQTGMELLR